MPARTPPSEPAPLRVRPLHAALALALGLAAALLVACGGSSGGGLIPVANSGPLQRDFEAVREAAETGDGRCGATEAALLKTAEDFSALPRTIDASLHNTLRQGIDNLRTRALALCTQPLIKTNTTSTPKTTSTPTTSTPTTTTATTTAPTTPTTPPSETPNSGGGTVAPTETPSGGGTGGGTGGGETPGGASNEAGGVGAPEGGR